MDDGDDKIVSLDARRRQDEARRKAEVAAQATERRKANGGARPTIVRKVPKGAVAAGEPAQRLGRVVGRALAMIVWGLLLATIVLAVIGQLT